MTTSALFYAFLIVLLAALTTAQGVPLYRFRKKQGDSPADTLSRERLFPGSDRHALCLLHLQPLAEQFCPGGRG